MPRRQTKTTAPLRKKTTKAKNGKAKNGRNGNSKYDDSFVATALLCAKRGMTTEDLAEVFKVGVSSVNRWIEEQNEFRDAVKEGRRLFDSGHVESACLKRAMGYEFEEVSEEFIEIDGRRYIQKSDGIGKDRSHELVLGVKRKITTKQIAPDVLAIMFWLQNRQPEDWKNVSKTEIQATGNIEHTHNHVIGLSTLGKDKLNELNCILAEAEMDTVAPGRKGRTRGRLTSGTD